MSDAKELRQLSDDEMLTLLEEKRSKIYQLKCSFAKNDKEAKPHFLHEERKNIARIHTILRMRQIEAGR